MSDPIPLADPERSLALAYAPKASREGLRAVFALDERLGSVVAAATEPGIAAIKLAWWRDALLRLDEGRAPAEPLLQAIGRAIVPRGVPGARLADVEAGWRLLVDGGDAAAKEHAEARGAFLFETAAAILGAHDPRLAAAGRGWALVDRARHAEDTTVRDALLAEARVAFAAVDRRRWPSRLRALGMLAILARHDAERGVLGQPGSPGRVLRALAHRATGR